MACGCGVQVEVALELLLTSHGRRALLHAADDDASEVRQQLQDGLFLLKNLMKKEPAATDADASSECRQPVPVHAVEQLLLQQRAAALVFRSRHTALVHALISAGSRTLYINHLTLRNTHACRACASCCCTVISAYGSHSHARSSRPPR
jgi:hypothetical protein